MVPEKSVNLWLVINKGEEECSRSSMGATLRSCLAWEVVNCLLPFVDKDKHHSKFTFHLSMFSKFEKL